ncbi:MAG: glycosyltransferase family 4 protein [Desulfuromonadaceae bacterium]|nr:glycosyltransferase family 4 protein [Desulfuromonadaceae bacterium]MDD2847532.1 glycosyltransferase family 4 protein [Desulfuromonadaceae bacterium]MDD4131355.1 glycosyltransferase family 4 protein [Desulfuromonadaceae bacterium]
MNIVFLAPFGIRPKGTLIARMLPLAVEIQARGHQVTIIAPPYTNPEDSGVVETVCGVRLVNIHLAPKGVFGTLQMAWRMLRAAMAEKPDLIHLFKPKGYGGVAAMLLILLRRCGVQLPPVVVDTDDLEGKGGMNETQSYSKAERRVFAFQEQWLLRRAAAVTAASKVLCELAIAGGMLPAKSFYLPNCVDDLPQGAGGVARQRLGIPLEAPVLLLYTRFFEFSQGRLHELFASIRRSLPEVRFLVVGQGRRGEEAELLRAADAGGFAAALVMAGWTEPKLLPDLLAAGDLAIYPFDDTLVNRAKCPAKLTELLRSGIPVVADRVGQITEYLAPELQSLLCTPGDVQAMSTRCVELLQNRSLCRELGAAGRHYILQHFSWTDSAAALEQVYQSISTAGEA